MSCLQFITPNWPAPANVRAYTTTRLGGISEPPWDSLNLADHVGDAANAVATNRGLLSEALDLPVIPYWLCQVHGNIVVDTDITPYRNHRVGDASITKEANRVCAVLTADCLPVLFCDRRGTRVGIAHAGWRGLVRGVIESTVRALKTEPADLLAWLGPGIGPGAFEVGSEVRDAFVRYRAIAELAFSPTTHDRWLADLYLLARQHLEQSGVREIYGGEFCTYHDDEYFFSYRRDGTTGRIASIIYFD
uniref:Purine nucleoside phosphorylase n=1 Tax=Candidatus Kentrum sp. FW TaxID=2126338 RepID=A0A450S6C2_9GAMM|nr:MAG: conserved hypothetical protein [Candidatus Kentron sp. FW]